MKDDVPFNTDSRGFLFCFVGNCSAMQICDSIYCTLVCMLQRVRPRLECTTIRPLTVLDGVDAIQRHPLHLFQIIVQRWVDPLRSD